jgi:integrase
VGLGTAADAPRQKSRVLIDDLRLMLRYLPVGNIGDRDRTLLLIGLAGALRRPELVSLDVSDVSFNSEGLFLTLRRLKADQDGSGRKSRHSFRLESSDLRRIGSEGLVGNRGISEGPIFRSIRRGGCIKGKRTPKTV